MRPPPNHPWQPDPELLAAYFDGELDYCAPLAQTRRRVEAWLEEHPEALAQGIAYQHLRKIWLDTTPREPSNAVWNRLLCRIKGACRRPRSEPARRIGWLAAGACVAGILLIFGLLFGTLRFAPDHPVDDTAPPAIALNKTGPGHADDTEAEVLPVAATSDVVILRVQGEDTAALVVGELPLHGPMELADPGEIRVFHVRPDARDQMVPHVRQNGPDRPMIWAYLDTDDD